MKSNAGEAFMEIHTNSMMVPWKIVPRKDDRSAFSPQNPASLNPLQEREPRFQDRQHPLPHSVGLGPTVLFLFISFHSFHSYALSIQWLNHGEVNI